jgi:hypothetical protein
VPFLAYLRVELEVVEKEYSEARNKIRGQHRQMAAEEKRPRIARAFSSSRTEDTIDINAPALPGHRELPLG